MPDSKDPNRMLVYGFHSIDESDLKAVECQLRSGWLTQGPTVEEFEQNLAQECGAKYAVAVNSATSGLHIACLAAQVGSGDEVITTPITFVASANCAFYCGARPVFADVMAGTALIDPDEIARKITSRTRAVIPVHMAGQSADMKRISEQVASVVSRSGRKIFIIEDASHALGGKYQGLPVGSCRYSDMVVLSFHPVKQITTCEGGAILTDDEMLYRRLKMLRSHGITKDEALLEDTSTLPWGYEQQLLGFNYRLPDVQCALGISQLKRLDQFIARRHEIAKAYLSEFKRIGIRSLTPDFSSEHAYHLFIVMLPFESSADRRDFMGRLREKRIVSQVHYIPVPSQPYYKRQLGDQISHFPHALEYYRQCLSIPIFPDMTGADVEKVVSAMAEITQEMF